MQSRELIRQYRAIGYASSTLSVPKHEKPQTKVVIIAIPNLRTFTLSNLLTYR